MISLLNKLVIAKLSRGVNYLYSKHFFPAVKIGFVHNESKNAEGLGWDFKFNCNDSCTFSSYFSLRKLAHAIYRDFLSFKNIEKFQLKTFDIFLIFAQNIDCGYKLEPPRRGGSNEYPQSMFWSKNKKNRYTPAYPSFAI